MAFWNKKKTPAPVRKRVAPVISFSPSKGGARSFYGAEVDNLTFTFSGSGKSANAELQACLRRLRMRSRQLYMDNDYVKKFLFMVKGNVVGPNGVRLQARAKRPDGTFDDQDNKTIEDNWKRWGNMKNCTVTRRQSWCDVQRMFIETVARDGEALVLIQRGFKNEYGFALRVLECDYLDEEHNVDLPNGNRIIMSVEHDEWGSPVAYWLKTAHPGDQTQMSGGRLYDRIPADDVIHGFMYDRPEQARGVPWLHTAIRRLNMLGGYEEAELVAARVGASKMGFFSSEDGGEYTGDGDVDGNSDGTGGVAAGGNMITEANPGTFENIGNMEFNSFDPTHPTTAYKSFLQGVIRGAASGLNVAYESLSNDREGVNYSSIRSGVIDERDQWRMLQGWLVETLHSRIYEAWLDYGLLTGMLPLPPRKVEKFQAVAWISRGWTWVDPMKDSKSNQEQLDMKTTTRTDIAAAQGKDLREVFEQLQAEETLAAEFGIDLNAASNEPTQQVEVITDE